MTWTLSKNHFYSLQCDIENFKFTSSYRIRKFHIYAKIHICGKMLLSYIFVWRKTRKIWYFRETETYENKRKYGFFCTFQKFLKDENYFFHAVVPIWVCNGFLIQSLCPNKTKRAKRNTRSSLWRAKRNIKMKWETVFISSEGLSDIIAIHPTIFAGRNQKL